MRQKADAYAAAKQRIFGCDIQGSSSTAAPAATPIAAPAATEGDGVVSARDAEERANAPSISVDTAAGSRCGTLTNDASASSSFNFSRPDPSVVSALDAAAAASSGRQARKKGSPSLAEAPKKAESRADVRGRTDPDYDRTAVRWTPNYPMHLGMGSSPGPQGFSGYRTHSDGVRSYPAMGAPVGCGRSGYMAAAGHHGHMANGHMAGGPPHGLPLPMHPPLALGQGMLGMTPAASGMGPHHSHNGGISGTMSGALGGHLSMGPMGGCVYTTNSNCIGAGTGGGAYESGYLEPSISPSGFVGPDGYLLPPQYADPNLTGETVHSKGLASGSVMGGSNGTHESGALPYSQLAGFGTSSSSSSGLHAMSRHNPSAPLPSNFGLPPPPPPSLSSSSFALNHQPMQTRSMIGLGVAPAAAAVGGASASHATSQQMATIGNMRDMHGHVADAPLDSFMGRTAAFPSADGGAPLAMQSQLPPSHPCSGAMPHQQPMMHCRSQHRDPLAPAHAHGARMPSELASADSSFPSSIGAFAHVNAPSASAFGHCCDGSTSCPLPLVNADA